MEVACIWDILFASCISQRFNDIRYPIESLVIPLIISQTARWSIECTGDHWRGCFDRCTEVTNMYDVLSESCISQTARWSIQCTRDHQRGCFDWHTEVTHIYDVLLESFTSQLSIDVRYWTRSMVVPSSYHKQPVGPLSTPEIIRGAALTDILRLHISMMYC